MCYNQTRQAGLALLSAILFVMIATAIVVSVTHEEAFAIRKTGRIQAMDRAGLYARGLEDWARIFLAKDRKEGIVDHLKEDWAIGIPGLPIENGFLSGYLEDEQSKFNLNSLLTSQESVNRFKRLCNNLEVDPTFVDALLDWMDGDFDVRYPDGAEEHYDSYRVANRLLVDVSELLLVKNVTPDIYNKLKPYITALPGATQFNVNTISETIYLALDDNLDASVFTEEREKGEFKDIGNFIERMQIPTDEADLSVNTAYFRAYGQVTQGDMSFSFDTLIHRNTNGSTSVLSRSLGRL